MIKKIINNLIKIKFIKKIIEIKRPNFIILYYHRVVKENDLSKETGPNIHLCVKENEFKLQMKFISENFNLISLEELYKCNFRCRKFSVAVTFDDGYLDNYEIAYPILKEYKVPATIFLVSKNFVSQPWAWWIELWNYLKKIQKINFEGKEYACLNNIQKEKAFFILKDKIKKLNSDKQLTFIKQLTNDEIRENHQSLFLKNNHIEEMKKDDLINFGCHTHDHLCFSNFSKEIIENEIEKSKKILSEKLNIETFHFAYPYGSSNDINYFEHNILKKLNFKSAVTTSEINNKDNSNFYLSRVSIGPFVNLEDFRRKLTGFDINIKKLLNFFQRNDNKKSKF